MASTIEEMLRAVEVAAKQSRENAWGEVTDIPTEQVFTLIALARLAVEATGYVQGFHLQHGSENAADWLARFDSAAERVDG